jgi:hypothetical protein
VDAGAHRVGLAREELEVARDDQLDERLEVRRPAPRVGVVPGVEIGGELEQPGPAVRPLEPAAQRRGEVRGLGGEVGGGQVGVERGADLGGLGQRGVRAQQADQHPVAVDGGVPVVAAVERRVERPRAADVVGAADRVLDVVGQLALDAGEREPRELTRRGRRRGHGTPMILWSWSDSRQRGRAWISAIVRAR